MNILFAETVKRAGGIVAVIRDQDYRIVWEGDHLHSFDVSALEEANKELMWLSKNPNHWDVLEQARKSVLFPDGTSRP
jgi:hypothetical protein